MTRNSICPNPVYRCAAFALFSLVLSACGNNEEQNFLPVIQPQPSLEIRQSAAAGDAAAQFAMASYHLGDENSTVMLRWLRASACQGYPLAQTSLGVLYEAGDGLIQDRITAYFWFSAAAQQGERDATDIIADLSATLEDDERAFAQALARQGPHSLPDCRPH